jgi:EAL domain-containing protein (putative c-di-GMP-specific phosphodiesterase class I)
LNVYAGTLADVDRFTTWLRQLQAVLQETRVVIEILETHVDELSFAKWTTLRQMFPSVEWAQDDFGIGERDLLRFMGWIPQWVKLDAALLTEFMGDEMRWDWLTQLRRWVMQRGTQVIVEGVETAQQAAWLRQEGCIFGQGYFLGLPELMTENRNGKNEVESELYR